MAFWCYRPDAWPDSQVNVIDELLCWVVESVPDGVLPLVQASMKNILRQYLDEHLDAEQLSVNQI